MATAGPLLVKLANYEGNPEIMLLAVRALTYLCDLVPRSADELVRHEVVPVLCGKLLAIEYLDLAEQCLQALEKISKKQPVPCLQAGTISAVLSYIDFFSTSVQRVALSTVANVCKKLPLDCSSLVMKSVPALCNLLQYEDRKLVETVATCLIRITESFSSSSELLDELCSCGMINKMLRLVAVDGQVSLSQTTYVGLIGLLTKLASKSLLAVRTLFDLNISNILRGILVASDTSHGTPYSPLQDTQPNQVQEVLKLLNQLIPSTSRDSEDIQLVLAKEKVIADEPLFLHQFSANILPAAIQLVNSGVNLYVCYCCVSIINNIVYFSTSDMLLDLLKNTNISSFLAGLLARKHEHVLFLTLKIVETLMQKLSGVFSSPFIKEGVIYAIDALLIQNDCSQSLSQQSSCSGSRLVVRDSSRCLCNAFNVCYSSSETKTCRLGKDAVRNLAGHIKATYFHNESANCGMGLTEILKKLKTYCAELDDNGNKYLTNDVAEKEDYLSDILGQVLRELSSGDTMSTFEFIESGVVKSLAHYLCNGRYLQGYTGSHNSLNHSLSVLTRFQTFAAISLSNSGMTWEDLPLTSFVRKLQSALSSVDNFPVILSHNFKPRNVLVDIPVKHTTMNPCLRVRFIREEGEESIGDCSEVLTVELSCTLDVIEGYLWPKINGNKNHRQAEPTGEDIESVDFASGSPCPVGRNHEDASANIVQKRPISDLPEILNFQGQTLLVDTGAKTGEIIIEKKSRPSSSSQRCGQNRKDLTSSKYDEHPNLIFAFEGKHLNRSLTLYQAILQSQIKVEPDMCLGPKFWNDIHKVTYKRAEPMMSCAKLSSDTSESYLFWEKIGFSWHKLSFFSSLLLAELPCKLDRLNPSYDILFMMKILEGLNRNSFQLLSNDKSIAFAQGRIKNVDDLSVVTSTIPQTQFISTKLTDKLEQQMQDPLALTTGGLPLWCYELTAVCPFLFSFEAKRKYFRLAVFGSSENQYPRQMHSSNSSSISNNERWSQTGLSQRKKFKVDRNNILESAAKMMGSLAHSKAVIEVEYNEEVGTGLGPTMEFYTLVSREFQKNGLGIWREDRSTSINGSEFVVAPFGLFPRPWSMQTSVSNGIHFSDVIRKFFLLGQLVAEAIKDKRMLDIPFSRAFYKVILEQEIGIYDIQSFDPELGKTLLEFQALVNRKRYLVSDPRVNKGDPFYLCFRNTRIEDLCLDFTLPGYSDYLLTSGSDPRLVAIDNLEEYVKLVVNATIKDGISRQVEAFKSGFNEVFPLKDLQMFTEGELERLLCGERDTWDFGQLLDHIKFDHGYTASSTSITNLLEIIQSFGCDERRAFLQFVTGAPRLPPGGLAALNPKMTIVRKHCTNDMDLPSVMTCANYLKLPSYSSKEKMRQRLLYAITEGQGSFHLS
ncbi:uncharacterized protein A4U43_C02F2300 [Asparagus officinalis]|uniref:HECT-type E3 ubiquitin transferase n=1 Tax=Asparagus officinalis TaxID=4686 RepID=A0A5P1FFY5_ASPOF|nr:E3 ubiquitin-protein ligase UPL4 [Asparagus officinalis]ONK77022.1 uncharacterized protein A4U43_C02F2300 [Asparagus officinalis]